MDFLTKQNLHKHQISRRHLTTSVPVEQPNDFKCRVCGRKLSTKQWLLQHEKSCRLKPKKDMEKPAPMKRPRQKLEQFPADPADPTEVAEDYEEEEEGVFEAVQENWHYIRSSSR